MVSIAGLRAGLEPGHAAYPAPLVRGKEGKADPVETCFSI